MTRRFFFSKFATVAGALLAVPKVIGDGFTGAQCGSPISPDDPLFKMTTEYLNNAVVGLDQAYSGCDRTYIWHPHAWRHLEKPEMLETVELDGEVFRLSPHPLRFDKNLNPDKETIKAHFREIESAWEGVKQT